MRRSLPSILCLLAACGGPGATDDSPPPVVLRWLDAPACLSDRATTTTTSPIVPGTAVVADTASQELQMREMALSFQEMYARFLVRPVLEEPAATQWDHEGTDARIEGRTVARGEDWGTLAVAATFSPPDRPRRVLRADVRYSVERTRFVFDDVVLDFGDGYRRLDDFVRGCDATTSINFVVGPWMFQGSVQDRVVVCWRDPSVALPAIDRDPVACRQAFDRTVPRDVVRHEAPLPAVFLF